MPVDCGSITPSSAEAATAASAAVPPAAQHVDRGQRAPAGATVATIAFWAWTVDRPAKWKFLIAMLSCSLALLGIRLRRRAGSQKPG